MAPQKSPAFQFYARDFLTGVATMSLAERGAYITLLAHQWDAGSVPAAAKERARILGCTAIEERRIWATLVFKFTFVDDVFRNERLEDERSKQAEYRRRQSHAGKASAATRKQPDGHQNPTTVEPPLQPEGKSAFASSFASSKRTKDQSASRSSRAPALITSPLEYERKHGHHLGGFCDWVCFPMELVDRFANKIPGSDDGLKRQQINEWGLEIRRQWADRIIPDGSDFDFWTNRWTETHGGSRPANATLKATRAAADLDEAFR